MRTCLFGISLHIVRAIRLLSTIDQFACMSQGDLRQFIPEILANPVNLHNLLRVYETRRYGIEHILGYECINWPLSIWRTIEGYVKGRPKLASILIPVECLHQFRKAHKSQRAKSDPTFKRRYWLAQRLFPLPLNWRRNFDMTDTLKLWRNIDKVHVFALHLWFQEARRKRVFQRLCRKKSIWKFRRTHRVLMPWKEGALTSNDVNFRLWESYSVMLDQIKTSTELFGHATYLRLLIRENKYLEERGFKISIKVCDFLQKMLEKIQACLFRPHQKRQYTSPEELCYYLDSWPRKRILQHRSKINQYLQGYELFDFYRLATIISWKLRDSCKVVLSRANRTKLQSIPSIRLSVYTNCFSLNERLDYVQSWRRNLSKGPIPDFIDESEDLKYIFGAFYSLPSEFNGIPVLDFLTRVQRRLAKLVESQLEITTEPKLVINVQKDIEISSKSEIDDMTLGYIIVSLAKQLFYGSREQFGPELRAWINVIANDEEEGGMGEIRELIMMANPITPSKKIPSIRLCTLPILSSSLIENS